MVRWSVDFGIGDFMGDPTVVFLDVSARHCPPVSVCLQNVVRRSCDFRAAGLDPVAGVRW